MNGIASKPRSLDKASGPARRGSQRLALASIVPIILVFAGNGVLAETEIHRCLLEDGTYAFQETPCPEPAPPDNDDLDAGNDREIHEEAVADEYPVRIDRTEAPTSRPRPIDPPSPESGSRDRSECEKRTRDAIDAIDLEMRENVTQDRRRDYLAELLALTEQLRACKQL